MNKRQKIVQEQFLNNEEAVIRKLKNQYHHALKDIEKKAQSLQDDINRLGTLANLATDEEEKAKFLSMQQSKVYQKQYQDALKKQIGSVLDNMQVEEFKTVSEYLQKCYEDGFIGTMFDLQGQGITMCFPLDQEAMVRAIQLDSKISQGLYTRLGEDVSVLKKKITAQVSRGIATGASFQQMAKQLSKVSDIGFNNAVRIARTEGHRIQVQSAMDACYKAKDKGADVVKQWDSTLDGRTRPSHQRVDGEIRELDEKFSNGLMYPGDSSGRAAEVVNCRCALLQRARWALDDDELQTLKDRAEYFGLDKADTFDDYKKKYTYGSDILQTPGNAGEKAIPYSERGIDIDARVKEYAEKLTKNGDYISVSAGAVKNQDLAILTTETGVEYTSLTIGDKAYLIRGLERSTTIPEELIDALLREKGTLDCHSHPFIGDLMPSESDKDFLRRLTWQKESLIIDPTQHAVKFTADGSVEVFNVGSIHDDEYYGSLFGGGDD